MIHFHIRPRQQRNEGYYRSRYSPPLKRIRAEYEDRYMNRYGSASHIEYAGMYGGGYDPYAALNPFQAPMMASVSTLREHAPVSDGLTQPPMMTLKQFLATQDDSISDDIAVAKYNEYKIDFKRSQLNEFFVAHKDEEW